MASNSESGDIVGAGINVRPVSVRHRPNVNNNNDGRPTTSTSTSGSNRPNVDSSASSSSTSTRARHTDAVINTLVGRARDVLRSQEEDTSDDGADFDTVRQTFRSFRRRRRGTLENTRMSKRGRTFHVQWKGTPFLMRRSNPDYFPSTAECRFLSQQNFGLPKVPVEPFNRNWDIDTLKGRICELYPDKSLGVVGFSFGKCDKGKKIHTISPANVRELEKLVKRGKVIIIPNRDIDLPSANSEQPLSPGTPTVSFRAASAGSSVQATEMVPPVNAGPAEPQSASTSGTAINEQNNTATHSHGAPILAPRYEEIDFNIDFSSDEPVDSHYAPPKIGTKELEADVKEAFLELSTSFSGEAEITAKREEVVEHLIELHTNPLICTQKLKVCFEGEAGDDLGGLTKEILTLFWNNATKQYFNGEDVTVPGLPLHRLRKEEWKYKSIGRILSHTVALTSALPCLLSLSGIITMVFDSSVNPEYLLKDFLLYVSPSEKVLIYKAINNFASLTPIMLNRLTTYFSVNGLLELPRKDEIKEQILAIASEKLIKAPSRFYALMKEGIPEAHLDLFWNHLSVEHISHILDSQRPTSGAVSEAIRTSEDDLRPEEERVLYFLTEYVRSLDTDDLLNFLFFVTGSIHMPEEGIKVHFVSTSGLLRRPVAHTCSNTLEISTSYSSRVEFKREMNLYLGDMYSYHYTIA